MAYRKVDEASLTAVADSIREKGGTTGALAFPDGFVSAVQAIQAGGGEAESVKGKAINFYDYDGTIRYSYTLEEAQELNALPEGPTHDGLVFDGWTHTLEQVKAAKIMLKVGATYATDDGTTRIYIRLEDGRTSPRLGLGINGTVSVDWGDGTTEDIITGTSISTVKYTYMHNYAAAGDYVIRLTVSGSAQIFGDSNMYSYLLIYSTQHDERNYVYKNAIRKIEIGNGINIGNYAFGTCNSISTIAIPNSVKTIGEYAFYNCNALENVIIPNSITDIGSYAFRITSLKNIIISNNITTIAANTLNNCSALPNVIIPNGVSTIENYAFYNDYGVLYYDFTAHTSVPTLYGTSAFSGIKADCRIRVPAALKEEWKAATNWATYASKIVGV